MAKSDPKGALTQARKVEDPWFRAQALSWVARFTDGDPVVVAAEAAKNARECADDYQRSAVRAWEVAALAERGFVREARKSLSGALELGRRVQPASSRAKSFLLLLQAALRIGPDEAEKVHEVLQTSCPVDEHWRCQRAKQDGRRIVSGEQQARTFFW